MRRAALVALVFVPALAVALEPPHPNPVACIERTARASISSFTLEDGKVVEVTVTILRGKDRKRCAGKLASKCLPPPERQARDLAKAVGFTDSHAEKVKTTRKVLSGTSLTAVASAKPYPFWNANALMGRIIARYRQLHDPQLAAKLRRMVGPADASGPGIREYGNRTVYELPLGHKTVKLEYMAVLYQGSTDYAEAYAFPLRLR